MPNAILTTELLLRGIEVDLEKHLQSYKFIEKTPDMIGLDMNGYKSGTQAYVSRKMDFAIRTGSDMKTRALEEGKQLIKAEQRTGIDWTMTSGEVAGSLSPSMLKERILDPARGRLISAIDTFVFDNVVLGSPNVLENDITERDILGFVMQLSAKLTSLGKPLTGRMLIVTPEVMTWLSNAIVKFMDPSTVGAIIRDGVVGRVFGFDVYVSPNLPTVQVPIQPQVFLLRPDTVPSWSVVKDSLEWSAKFLATDTNLDNMTVKKLPKNTRFTIEGAYALNSLSHVKQRFLLPFMLLEDLTIINKASPASSDYVKVKMTPPPLAPPSPTQDAAYVNVTSFPKSATQDLKCKVCGGWASTSTVAANLPKTKACVIACHESAVIVPQVQLTVPPQTEGSVSSGPVFIRIIRRHHMSSDSWDTRTDWQGSIAIHDLNGVILAFYAF